MKKTAEITYRGELRTEAVHLRSGNQITTDAPVDNQGKGEAFSPTDLVATALGSCILTIMGIAAERHEIDILGAKVEVTKVMASDPRRISELKVELSFPHNNYSEKERKILEKAAHGCPVRKSLSTDLHEELIFVYPT